MSKFDPVWRSLENKVSEGWAPGIVAGVRHRGETEYFATGSLAFDSTERMTAATQFRIASLSKLLSGTLAASLIADGVMSPDDEIARWMPELAHPRVLTSADAELDQTVAADKPITVAHLLRNTYGQGVTFEPTPFSAQLATFGFGPFVPAMPVDDFIARIAALPLAHQPGTRWMYHTAADLLSALFVRVTGRPARELLHERILDPVGMPDTAFFAAGALPTEYEPGESGLEVAEQYTAAFSAPPVFESLAGGLVSTVPDFLAFLAALEDDLMLPPGMKERMTADHLDDTERRGIEQMMGPGLTWGWQVSVHTAVTEPWTSVGRYGWNGGSGTSAYVDPSRDLIGVVMTQRFMTGPRDDFAYFWEPLAAVADRAG